MVNDLDGEICGAQFDVFTGSDTQGCALLRPAFGKVGLPGIEDRVPPCYADGLSRRQR